MAVSHEQTTRSPFSGPDAPLEADLARCVHCGLCLSSCPTYLATGLAAESPRGRIYLIRAAEAGRVPLHAAVGGHMELCLQCRNCEAVCPSGVPFGRIMERTRAQLLQHRTGPFLPRALRVAATRALFPHPRARGRRGWAALLSASPASGAATSRRASAFAASPATAGDNGPDAGRTAVGT